MMQQNEKKDDTYKSIRFFDWAFFINKKRKERNKKYEELCRKYEIDKEIWTLGEDFNLLENYIFKLFELCNAWGVIYYFKNKEQPKSAIEKNNDGGYGPNIPTSDAEFALFNLDIETRYDGRLFCLFEKNNQEEVKQDWIFVDFISFDNIPPEWRNINEILNCIEEKEEEKLKSKLNKFFKFEEFKFKFEEFKNEKFTDDSCVLEHIMKNKDRFLTSDIQELFNTDPNHKAVKEIIETFICFNLKQINKDECLYSWPLEELKKRPLDDEDDGFGYIPINFLYPFRLGDDVCAAMVFRVLQNNFAPQSKKVELRTILDLEQAYKGAKLYDLKFESEWLTLENVKKAREKGCYDRQKKEQKT